MNSTTSPFPVVVSSCGWPPATFPKNSTERHSVRYLDLYSYPLLLSIATAGNAMNVIILKREKPCASKNLYLIAIALSDLVFMWSGLFSYISNFDGEIHGHPTPNIQAMAGAMRGVGYFCQEAAALVSSWVIIAFSAERFLAIKYPLKHRMKNNLRQCRINIYGTFCTAVVLAVHRLVDYYWFYANYQGRGSAPQRPSFLAGWNKAYTWGIALFQMVTFTVILILNAMLLREVLRAQKFQRKELVHSTSDSSESSLTSSSHPSGTKATARQERNALILLGGVVLLFLSTQLPVFVYNVLHLMEKSCLQQVPINVKRLAIPAINILLNVNYSCNFLVYCSVDRRFRASVYSFCHAEKGDRRQSAPDVFRLKKTHHGSDKSTAPLFVTGS